MKKYYMQQALLGLVMVTIMFTALYFLKDIVQNATLNFVSVLVIFLILVLIIGRPIDRQMNKNLSETEKLKITKINLFLIPVVSSIFYIIGSYFMRDVLHYGYPDNSMLPGLIGFLTGSIIAAIILYRKQLKKFENRT